MSGSEDEAAPVTKAEFGRLLTAIAGIQDQMQSMKRELVEDREAANERLVKRIRLEKAPSFKKKGHEKQFRFNEEVRELKDRGGVGLPHRYASGGGESKRGT